MLLIWSRDMVSMIKHRYDTCLFLLLPVFLVVFVIDLFYYDVIGKELGVGMCWGSVEFPV